MSVRTGRVCGLFNDTVVNSNTVKMTYERRTVRDCKGSGHGLIEALSRNLPGRSQENQENC